MKKHLYLLCAALCLCLAGCAAAVQPPAAAGPESAAPPAKSSAAESASESAPVPAEGSPESISAPDESVCAPVESDSPPAENGPESISAPQENTPPAARLPSADPAEEALAALRHAAAEQGALCAAAYLGYAGPQQGIEEFMATDAAAALLEQQPFLAAIGDECRVRQPGGEVYCVVPAAGTAVTVHVYQEEGLTPPLEKGESSLLYAGGDAPILLQGNVSDILPNLQVTVTAADGAAVTFAPTLSLKDGSFYPMGADAAVLDFTV